MIGMGSVVSQKVTAGPPVVTYDADYQAVLDYAISQGFNIPSEPWRDFENQLMVDLKASGAFAKFVYFRNYRGNGDLDYKSINWKNPGAYNATRINSLVVDNNKGFKSDGTSYIRTGVNPPSNVLVDVRVGFMGFFLFEDTNTSNDFTTAMGARISFSIKPFSYNGTPMAYFNGLENPTGGVIASAGGRLSPGFHLVNRNIGVDYTWRVNDVLVAELIGYTGTRNVGTELIELGENNGSGGASGFFREFLSVTFLGNQTLNDLEKTNFRNAVQSYLNQSL